MFEESRPGKLSAEDIVANAILDLAEQINEEKDPVEKEKLRRVLDVNIRVSSLQASERRQSAPR